MLKDSVREHDRVQWQGLNVTTTMSTIDDIAILELEVKGVFEEEPPIVDSNPTLVGQRWSWTTGVPCSPPSPLPSWAGAELWSPASPHPQQAPPTPVWPPLEAPPEGVLD